MASQRIFWQIFVTTKELKLNIIYKGSAEYIDGSNDPANPNLPFTLQTVYQQGINDGFGSIATTTYAYSGGDYYFSGAFDRKCAGFGKIETTNSLSYVSNTYYHQGNTSATTTGEYDDDVSKIGRVYRTEIYDDSQNLYSKSISKWDQYALDDNRTFVKFVRSLSFSYDGDVDHKEKAEEYTYGNTYGNLSQRTKWGQVSGSDNGTFTDTGTDKYTTDYTYIASTTPYIVGLPKQETVKAQNELTVKDTKYYYDSLAFGNVDRGNLTKQELWATSTTYIDIEKTYNIYGLVTQEKDPRDKTTDYVYDEYNLRITTSTNALSQAIDLYYDYSSGQVKKRLT